MFVYDMIEKTEFCYSPCTAEWEHQHLVRLGHEYLGERFHMDIPAMNWCFITLVVKGELELIHHGRSQHAKPGHGVFWGPGGDTCSLRCCDVATELWTLEFAGDHVMSLARELFGAPIGTWQVNRFVAAADILSVLFRASGTSDMADQAIGHAALPCLLRLLLHHQSVQTAPWNASSFVTCKSYVDEHYLQTVEVGSVAAACHIDPSYMGRLFRKHLGMTAHTYLTRLRMGHAARLLVSTEMSVRDIAEELNYADQFAFSKAFKRIYGKSPRAYRTGC